MRLATLSLITIALLALTPGLSSADDYADLVVDFSPVIKSGQPTAPHLEPNNSLGAPDYAGDNDCDDAATCTFVSLGDGGSLTVQFVDNALTGSGDSAPDLWIYEIGPDVEDTFVEISADNITWYPVGKVFGSTATIDIDAFGFTPLNTFVFVRLTDDENEGGNSGNTVGADIDAVEALSTRPVPVHPMTWGLLKARY